jgi:hypothetical protein
MWTCASVIMRSSSGLDGVLTEAVSHIRVPDEYIRAPLRMDRRGQRAAGRVHSRRMKDERGEDVLLLRSQMCASPLLRISAG